MSIRCPSCNCGHNRVTHTKPPTVITIRGKKIEHIRRRRVCRACGYGWWTTERNEEDAILTEEAPLNLETPPPPEKGNPFL